MPQSTAQPLAIGRWAFDRSLIVLLVSISFATQARGIIIIGMDPYYPVTTTSPTSEPTGQPSFSPTFAPSAVPTLEPTFVPTAVPTFAPSSNPRHLPPRLPATTTTTTPAPTALPARAPRSSIAGSPPPTLVPTLRVDGDDSSTNAASANKWALLAGFISLLICVPASVHYSMRMLKRRNAFGSSHRKERTPTEFEHCCPTAAAEIMPNEGSQRAHRLGPKPCTVTSTQQAARQGQGGQPSAQRHARRHNSSMTSLDSNTDSDDDNHDNNSHNHNHNHNSAERPSFEVQTSALSWISATELV
jgi:hypothetical protein